MKKKPFEIDFDEYVRANYKNLAKGIEREPMFLEMFFKNMLMGERNELKNRYMHVNYKSKKTNINVKKPNIDNKKVNIGIKKQNIDVKKLNIGAKKSALIEIVQSKKLNATRKKNILSVIEKIALNQIFGATDVMGASGCKRTAAAAILAQMFELGLTEKVNGHGKGKYQFKESEVSK